MLRKNSVFRSDINKTPRIDIKAAIDLFAILRRGPDLHGNQSPASGTGSDTSVSTAPHQVHLIYFSAAESVLRSTRCSPQEVPPLSDQRLLSQIHLFHTLRQRLIVHVGRFPI